MGNEKNLTKLQLWAIMLCGCFYSFMTHFPFTDDSIQAVMISMIFSSLIQFVIVLPVIIIKEKYPDENVCGIMIKKHRFSGMLFYAIYTVVFMLGVFSLVGNFAYFAQFYFAQFIPRTIIVISCVFAAVYLGGMKSQIIGKTAFPPLILFGIFTLAVIFGTLNGTKKIDFINFNVAQKDFTNGILRGIRGDFALSWDLVLFVFLQTDMKGKGRNSLKTASLYLGTKLVFLELILTFITMILGDYGRYSKLAFFSTASYSSSSFIQRFDAVFMFLWVVTALVKISAFIHCGARGLKDIFPKLPFKTSAIICGILPSALAVSLLAADKWKKGEFFLKGILLELIVVALIPLITLIVCRKRKEKICEST